MSGGQQKLLRKRMPLVYKHIKNGAWYIAGTTGNGHIWLVHSPSGRKITAPSSAGDYRSERNLLRQMGHVERGINDYAQRTSNLPKRK
jgi:hypothetical protein